MEGSSVDTSANATIWFLSVFISFVLGQKNAFVKFLMFKFLENATVDILSLNVKISLLEGTKTISQTTFLFMKIKKSC